MRQKSGRTGIAGNRSKSVVMMALMLALSSVVAVPASAADESISVAASGPTWTSVSWSPHQGASGYQVFRDGSFVTYTTNTTARLDGLTFGLTYAVEVKAVLPNQTKSTIGRINVTPINGGSPDGSVSVEGFGSTWASVSWPPRAGASGYQVLQNGSFETYTTSTTATLNGLTSGVAYAIEVRAVLPDQTKASVGTVNLTPRNAGSSDREISDNERENNMVDPDGDASGWEDNLNFVRGTMLDRLELNALFFYAYVKVQEDEAGFARQDANTVVKEMAEDYGIGKLGPLGTVIDIGNRFDDVTQHNRMVEELAKRGRAINQLEKEREEHQKEIESLEGQLQDALDALNAERAEQLEGQPQSAFDALNAERIEQLKTEIRKGNLEISKGRKRMNVVYRKMYVLEQAELRYGEGALRAVPRICVEKDTFNSRRCGAGYEAWWELGRNILHLPRYCARSNTTYSCATGGRALNPENPRRPAFGEFKCKANGAVYWSNGRDAYSQIADDTPARCADVHPSWAFTGKFRARTGGKTDYRPLNHNDCPIQGETGQLNLSCKGKIVDVDPPGYPWECIEHDKTGNWKCPGDSSYSRPEPVNTSIQDPSPKGDFTCQFNGLSYYSNGTAYRLTAATTSDIDQWLCRDVTLVFHVYCEGTVARVVTPPNRKKQICGSSGGSGWIPSVGNFRCPSNNMRYYSNGRNAYVHHTYGTPVPCPDVSSDMRFDGSSAG